MITNPNDNLIDLVDLIETRALLQPEDLAYAFLGSDTEVEVSWTYRQLRERVLAWAEAIGNVVKPGDRVVLTFPPGLDFIAAFFGGLYCGVTVVPTYPPSRRGFERFSSILNSSLPSAIATNDTMLAKIEATLASTGMSHIPLIVNTKAVHEFEPRRERTELAFIQYTSGSTSDPKGVCISHTNVLQNQAAIRDCFRHNERSRIMGWLPVYHDMGLIGVVMQPLFVGVPCYMMSPAHFIQNPMLWLMAISRYKITTTGGPNFAYDLCVNKIERAVGTFELDLSCWRVAFNGAELVRSDTLLRFAETFSTAGFKIESFLPCYGLAEATLLVAGRKPKATKYRFLQIHHEALEKFGQIKPDPKGERTIVSCGAPALGTEIRIVNPELSTECVDGTVGEIWVAGDGVAVGYYTNARMTTLFDAQLLNSTKNYLRTGDFGAMLDGELYVTGRLKEILVQNGRKLHPQDIEATIAIALSLRRESIAVYPAVEEDRESAEAAIEIQGALPNIEFMRSSAIDAVWQTHQIVLNKVTFLRHGNLPRTTSGKPQRARIHKLLESGALRVLGVAKSTVDVAASLTVRGTNCIQEISTHLLESDRYARETPKIISLIEEWFPLLRGIITKDHSLATLGIDSLGLAELRQRLSYLYEGIPSFEKMLEGISVNELCQSLLPLTRSVDHKPRLDSDVATLSSLQKRFIVLEQLALDGGEYTVSVRVSLQGDLDERLLKRSIAFILRRHHSLWLIGNFTRPAATPFFEAPEAISIEDVNPYDGGKSLNSFHCRRFEEHDCPLFRFGLVRYSPNNAELLVCFHHMVADGWSIRVFVKEVMACYAAGYEMRELVLPIAGSYSALIERMARIDQAKLLVNWAELLYGAPMLLRLPNLAESNGCGSATHYESIPPALTVGCAKLARSLTVSTAAVWLSAFSIVLSRWTTDLDLLIGSPIMLRDANDELNSVGMYLNVLPIRIKINEDKTSSEYIQSTARAIRDTHAGRYCDFDLLVESLRPPREAGRTPIFQVLFNYLGDAKFSGQAANLKYGCEPYLANGAKYDLSMYVVDSPGQESLTFSYRQECMSVEFASAFAQQVIETVEQFLVESVDKPLKLLRCKSPVPSGQVLQHKVWPGSLSERLRYWAEKPDYANTIALQDEIEELTYRQLDQVADGIAWKLQTAGVEQGGRVAILGRRSSAVPLAIAGVMRLGGVFTVIDAAYPKDRIQSILENLAPNAILLANVDIAECPLYSSPVLNIPNLSEMSKINLLMSAEKMHRKVGSEEAACITFTSGSTGTPLAVLGRQSGLTAFQDWTTETFNLKKEDRFSMLSALSHDPLQRDIVSAWWIGGTLCVPPCNALEEPAVLYDWLNKVGITVANLTPAIARLLTYIPGTVSLTSLRQAFFVGEQLSGAAVSAFQRIAPLAEVVSYYGTTETQRALAAYRVPSGTHPPPKLPLGTVPPGVELFVSTKDSRTAVGEVGEICFRSYCLALGYLNDDRQTNNAFEMLEDGSTVYRTGDLGRFEFNGSIHILGRADRQVAVRGYRIALEEIELCTMGIGGIIECRAKWYADSEALIIYVSLNSEDQISTEDIRTYLLGKLPAYMVPSSVSVLPRLPRNVNGKIDDSQLYWTSLRCTGGQELVGDTQHTLATLFKRILGVSQVFADDGFINLGGHSLRALELQALVRQDLNKELSLSEIFTLPTLAHLATLLEERSFIEQEEVSAVQMSIKDEETFPLTDIQEAYWIGRQDILGAGIVGSHSYYEFELTSLNLSHFQYAWNKVCARHPMMRAVFTPDGRQKILTSVADYVVECIDAREYTALSVDHLMLGIRNRCQEEVFDPSVWPLFRIVAVQLPENKTRMVFSVDFLVADAWSWLIIGPELKLFYEDPMCEITIPPLTFREYVERMTYERNSVTYKRALEYWKKRIPSIHPSPQLPLREIKLPPAPTQRLSAIIPVDRWQSITNGAKLHGLTPSAVVLTVYAEVIALWAKEPAFTLNLTTFDRDPRIRGLKSVVGDFTSSLLVPFNITNTASFLDLARSTQASLIDGLNYRSVSGVQVLREVNAYRAENGMPSTMPVVMTSKLGLDNSGTQQLREWLGDPIFAVSQTPQVWIDAQISENVGALKVDWDVNPVVLEHGVMSSMFKTFIDALLHLSLLPLSWEAESLVSIPAEHLEVQSLSNDTSTTAPEGLLQAPILSWSLMAPDQIAIVDDDGNLTFRQMQLAATQVSHRLNEIGVEAQQSIPILMDKSRGQIIAALGILGVGATFVPIDPQQGIERILSILAQLKATAVLCLKGAIHDHRIFNGRIRIDVSLTISNTTVEISKGVEIDPDSTAYVIFTSGSTGDPKGVMISHTGALNTCIDINSRFAVTHEDAVLALSAFSFDLSIYDLFGVLGAGGRMILPSPADLPSPERWFALAKNHSATIWNTTPSLMLMLVQYCEDSGNSLPNTLRLVLLSGDWIPGDLPMRIRRLSRNQVTIACMGGATEASIWSILHVAASREYPYIPYGKALVNQSFHVLDSRGRQRPFFAVGELYIGGIGLAKGYFKNEKDTEHRFISNSSYGRLYRAGDLGRWLPNGEIQFLGREDTQVKINGYRVELGEVERALSELTCLSQAVVVTNDRALGKRLVAYVCQKETEKISENEIREELRNKLPGYMIPSEINFLSSLPLNFNGKVDRKELHTWAMRAEAPVSGHHLQESELEANIRSVFEQSLGSQITDPDISFMRLGGTSLQVPRIQVLLKERHGIEVSLADIFQQNSVRSLARLINTRKKSSNNDTSLRFKKSIARALNRVQAQADRTSSGNLRP